MRAIVCDCCGKIMEYEKGNQVRYIEIRKSDGNTTENVGYFNKEVCEECASNVEALLGGVVDARLG